MTTEEYEVRRRQPGWKYYLTVENSKCKRLNRINPLKQRLVSQIYDAALEDAYIKRIIVFGSAARYDCHQFSDLDLCLEWKGRAFDEDGVLVPETLPLMRKISRLGEGQIDVLQWEAAEGQDIMKNIEKEGVVVFG